MTSSSSIDLPDEVIELILSKCPVKSAVRFTSVSRSWQSIISSPRFFRILQSKLSDNQKSKFLISARLPSKNCDGLYLIRFEDGKFQRESALEYPFKKPVFTMCSCDGLILLCSAHYDEHMLWNPLIKKHIIIPAFNPETHPQAFRNWPQWSPNPWGRNLYFDSITNDHKIMFFYEKCYTIYSCKNGSWGEIKDILGDLDLTFYKVCVDGCIYDDERNGEIVFFDARDGKLHNFPQPNDVNSLVGVELVAVSGRLCLYGFNDYRRERLQLWVMENKHGSSHKCWRKLISMDKVMEPYAWNLRPLCLSNEDGVVLCGRDKYVGERYKYFIYNSRKSCSFQEIDVDSTLKSIMPNDPEEYFPYSENLYMPSSNICQSVDL